MSSAKKIIIISHPDTLKGFAAAYAAWYGLYVACPPDQERPEVELDPLPLAAVGGQILTINTEAAIGLAPGEGSEIWAKMVPGYPVPDVLRYVEDEALALPASKEVRAYLATVPRTAEGLLDFLNFDRQVAAFAGAAVLRAQAQALQPLINVYLGTLPDYEDEWYCTRKELAEGELSEFTTWLAKRSGGSKE